MAKITLNAPLLATITGPTKTTRWRTLRSGQVQATQKPTAITHSPRVPGWPSSPYLTSPPTWDADCKAWKKADQDYTREVVKLREVYRAYNTKPHTSTYDAWMKQALPHYLRGLQCNINPLPQVAWSLRRMVYTPETLFADHFVQDFLMPPPECQTWGLWYANVRFRHYYLFPPSQDWPATDVTLALGHTTLWPVPQPPPPFVASFRENPPDAATPGHVGHIVYDTPPPPFPHEADVWTINAYTFFGHFNYASLEVQDWLRLPDGTPADPPQVAPDRRCLVAWLDGDLAFTHWPRAWPSKRPARSWLPPGWPPAPW